MQVHAVSKMCSASGDIYLACQTEQSVDLIVIGYTVFTLSRGLSFPYAVVNGTTIITVPFISSPSVSINSILYSLLTSKL